jgi:ankyrin repeat protein
MMLRILAFVALTLVVLLVSACHRKEEQKEKARNRVLRTGEPTAVRPSTLAERFLEAVRQGDLAMVRTLLEQGADIRAKDGLGSTALLLGVRKTDNVELVRFLYERAPALLDERDTAGRTPLSWAAEQGHLSVLRFLGERGAMIDTRDASGHTPLFQAVLAGQREAAQFLIERGANVNVRDQYGDTPLMMASAKGHTALVRLLLESKADAKVKNQEGRTALDRAVNDEIRRLLRGG